MIASYMFSDRHCVITTDSPAYLHKLLLATGIILGVSGFFNITAVLPVLAQRLMTVYPVSRIEGRKDEDDQTIWNTGAGYGEGICLRFGFHRQ
jgi:hypothetical protein